MKTQIEQNWAGKRLDCFLQSFLNMSRSEVQKNIENEIIKINGENKKASYKLKIGDIVEFEEANLLKKEEIKILPQKIPLDILFEDDEFLVVNKPKNMLTHPTSTNFENTLVNALMAHCGENLSDIGGELRRGIVHRLDKNTAGLLVAAKTNEAHENLAEQIKNKTMTRKYLGVALGNFENEEGVINKPIAKNLGETVKMYIPKDPAEGKYALTRYRVLEHFDGAAFLEMQLETGRTHQIRIHLASINHPIFGDTLYGSRGFQKFSKIKTKEQVLQSYFLSFTHPKTGAKMEFKLKESRWDKDLPRVLKILRRSEREEIK